jgi:predicted PurR-regulated permease PerM
MLTGIGMKELLTAILILVVLYFGIMGLILLFGIIGIVFDYINNLGDVSKYAKKHFIKKVEQSILLLSKEVKSLNQVTDQESNLNIVSHLDELKKNSNTFDKVINNIVTIHDKFISPNWKEDENIKMTKDNLLKLFNPK